MEYPYYRIERSFKRALGSPNYQEFGGWLEAHDYTCISCGLIFTNQRKKIRSLCGKCERLFDGSMACIEVTEKEMNKYAREQIAMANARLSIEKANSINRKRFARGY